jgi:hypothetical protein
MMASTCRTSFAIWIVLAQSSTVNMPRGLTIIFNETVVVGTVLFPTSLLESAAPSPSLRNRELLRDHRQGRIQVDEAPGLCARAYGAVIRVAGSRSRLPDPLS